MKDKLKREKIKYFRGTRNYALQKINKPRIIKYLYL